MKKERENWMQKLDRQKDEMFEKKLNKDLENAFLEWESLNASDDKDDITELKKVLEKIVKIYRNLKIEGFEYNKEDYQYFSDRLEKLIEIKKYKDLEKAHIGSNEYQSWEDYKKEESIEEKNENRDEEGQER